MNRIVHFLSQHFILCLLFALALSFPCRTCARDVEVLFPPERMAARGAESSSEQHSPVDSYASLVESIGGLEAIMVQITRGADWLINVSQIQSVNLPPGMDESRYNYSNWKGAFRNEYDAASRAWSTYGPVWHGGQAIRGLVAASKAGALVASAMRGADVAEFAGLSAAAWRARTDAWMAGAELCAGFITDKQVHSLDKENGMIPSYENSPNLPQSSTMLEGMRGLYDLTEATGDQSYAEAADAAVKWSVDNAWINGSGLLYDLWDRKNQSFLRASGWNYVTPDGVGRPLADDWVYLELYRRTNYTKARVAFLDVINRLYGDERPRGNWVDFVPCNPRASHGGWLHPRQAFWWGRPFLQAYNETSVESYLHVAQRAGEWYVNASRLDGGLIRETAVDFTTSTCGQVTSGIACAALLWMDIHDYDKDSRWLAHVSTGLAWLAKQQFDPDKTSDPNLRGAFLELMEPPDGSDRAPYHLRDIATSFSLQALARVAAEHLGRGGEITHSSSPAQALDG